MIGGYYPREKAEKAAQKAAEEWGFSENAYDMEEAVKEPFEAEG